MIITNNTYKIFYLDDPVYIRFVSGIANIIWDRRMGTNIMGYSINITSATHCSDGTGSYVFSKNKKQ